MLKKVRNTIEKYKMLNEGDRVLVAVSGGPDSVAMLDVFMYLRGRLGISLSVAHMNHMFRKGEADEDARYVEELARKQGLRFFYARKNVPLLVKRSKLSPEQAARKLRYVFLEESARKEGANKVALGQTADDQAETVLIYLIRGSGACGLSGIRPVRSLGETGIRVIRPMIEVYRNDIEKYLSERRITPRIDSSNLEIIYLRNKIRSELIPHLELNYNRNIKQALVRLAGILRVENNYLDSEAKKFFHKISSGNKGEVRLDPEVFRSIPSALAYRVFRESLRILTGRKPVVALVHWEDVRKLAEYGSTGSRLNLPDGIVVKKGYCDLVISRYGSLKDSYANQGPVRIGRRDKRVNVLNIVQELKVPGESAVQEANLTVRTSLADFSGGLKGIRELFDSADRPGRYGMRKAVFDFDKVRFPLHVRFRMEGDRFKPLGMKKAKKLKDFFIDRKVPVDERDRVPLLIGNGTIIWVMDCEERGFGIIAEDAKVVKNTRKLLEVEIVLRQEM